ncbi:MAG: TIGR04438 family Trp-rich protein [Pseudomonadota bacterium]
MWFVVLAIVLIALKLLDISVVAAWPWWWVLSPLAAALLWWWWADASGYTKRKEMDKMDEKKVMRRRKSLEALGLDYRAFDKEKKRATAFKTARQREVEKVEGAREAERKKQRDSIINSRFDSSRIDSTQQAGDDKS